MESQSGREGNALLRVSSEERGARTRLSLSATLSRSLSPSERLHLVEILAQYAAAPLHVVLSAESQASPGWINAWVDVLGVVEYPITVQFDVRHEVIADEA